MLFEQASKLKLRFGTVAGQVSTEDLWDLPLISQGTANLDDIAKSLNVALKESSEESFVFASSAVKKTIELKLDIVKHVIKCKLEDIAKSKKAIESKDKKEQLLSILADKEDDALKKKTPAQIKKMIDDL